MTLKITKRIVLYFACFSIIIGVFLSGLWPLNFFQRNKVSWNQHGNGLVFNRYGIVYGKESIGDTVFSTEEIAVEIVLKILEEPGDGIKRIVSFYNPEKRYEEFFIGQWRSHLIIRCRDNGTDKKSYREIGQRYILRIGNIIHLTISSGKKGTSIYIDGKLVKAVPDFKLIQHDAHTTGKLILGNSPNGIYGWKGLILTLAMYNKSLTEEKVFNNYEKWKQNNIISQEIDQVMLYLFNEGTGHIVHDQSGSAHHLFIPQRFIVPKKDILSFPRLLRFKRSDILDILLNILGFIPLGFIIALGVIETRINSKRWQYIYTFLICFCISFSIEILQVFLPARDSSLLDLLLNVLGAGIGVSILLFAFLFNRQGNPVNNLCKLNERKI